MKSHNCPCVGDTGSPNQQCTACFGRGFFWDPGTGPWIVLMTLVTWIGRNVDMGENTDPDYGMVFQGHPIITIPATLEPIWSQANTNDIFVQIDAFQRFQAVHHAHARNGQRRRDGGNNSEQRCDERRKTHDARRDFK